MQALWQFLDLLTTIAFNTTNEVGHMSTSAADTQILDIAKLEEGLATDSATYRAAAPFPHIVLENLLNPSVITPAITEYPSTNSSEWAAYAHVNERKWGSTDSSAWGPTLQSIAATLNSPEFVSYLEKLTGITGLFPDDTFNGGGLHQSLRGGFLNVHADFTVHPYHQDWERRVNVLVYFNENWDESWGGQLELWKTDMTRCERSVVPEANRCVIFTTDPDAFHGHPTPMTCPEGTARRSMALYYFVKNENANIRSTEYRARPGDGVKSLFIWLDKYLVRAFDWSKRHLGVSDALARKFMPSNRKKS